MSFLLDSIEEHSVLWLVLSATVGAVIGALLKFVFESVAVTRFQQGRAARASMRRYRYPLLRAADALDRRLQNFIQFVGRGWYEDAANDYYRVSTLYVLGCYFGWCKIIEEEAFIEFVTSDRQARRFSSQFYGVFKALTSFSCFEGVPPGEIENVEGAAVPRFILTAIGELMIAPAQAPGEFPRMLSFVSFTEKLRADPAFAEWFCTLEKYLLVDQERSRTSARWNRIVVFATMLRAFVSYLDPKSRQTAPRHIWYLGHLHAVVATNVRNDLAAVRMAHLIRSKQAPTA